MAEQRNIPFTVDPKVCTKCGGTMRNAGESLALRRKDTGGAMMGFEEIVAWVFRCSMCGLIEMYDSSIIDERFNPK